VIPSWGFSSFVGPLGLVAALPPLWSRRKRLAAVALVLNGALTMFLALWLTAQT
jgi:hypothetical protein